jgi:hypothetical protein
VIAVSRYNSASVATECAINLSNTAAFLEELATREATVVEAIAVFLVECVHLGEAPTYVGLGKRRGHCGHNII